MPPPDKDNQLFQARILSYLESDPKTGRKGLYQVVEESRAALDGFINSNRKEKLAFDKKYEQDRQEILKMFNKLDTEKKIKEAVRRRETVIITAIGTFLLWIGKEAWPYIVGAFKHIF